MNERQKATLERILQFFQDNTEDTMSDYGDLPGHAKEVQEMKEELETVNEIRTLFGIPIGK